jgi:hypothetical protein
MALYTLFYYRPSNFLTASFPWLHTEHPWVFLLPAFVAIIGAFRINIVSSVTKDLDPVAMFMTTFGALFIVGVVVLAYVSQSNQPKPANVYDSGPKGPQGAELFVMMAFPVFIYLLYRCVRFGIVLMWIPGGKAIHKRNVALGKKRNKAEMLKKMGYMD